MIRGPQFGSLNHGPTCDLNPGIHAAAYQPSLDGRFRGEADMLGPWSSTAR